MNVSTINVINQEAAKSKCCCRLVNVVPVKEHGGVYSFARLRAATNS